MKKLRYMHCHPSVCAVGEDYIICVPMRCAALMHVEIGDKKYYNHQNGIRISNATVQMFKVPQSELDRHKKYTIKFRRVIFRWFFFTPKLPEYSLCYDFQPIEKTENINICHIADCHGQVKNPSLSGEFFGSDLDLLILNGDINTYSAKESQLLNTYKISSNIAKGKIPVIISRGNHDLRGRKAQALADYFPMQNQRTYFTVRLGPLWFMIFDCGEDKLDSHFEYFGTVACEPWRREEDAYFREVIAARPWEAEGVGFRLLLCHVPLSLRNTGTLKIYKEPPFDIENELYDSWIMLSNENIHPDMFIAGHYHNDEIIRRDSEKNDRHLDCDLVIGGYPVGKKENFVSANFTLRAEGCEVYFADKDKNITKQDRVIFYNKKN